MSRRPYFRTVSRYGWWFAHPRYLRYMARELSSAFVGAYGGLVMFALWRLWQGEAEWNALVGFLQSPPSIGFHLVALAFALYHTITWFNVTPKAMPVQIGDRQFPGGIIVGTHYFVWAVVSLALFILAGAGT
ncbi:MAG: fumarate reductase subunit C [Alphaproteobacteria bacterium]|nr:fumarate reductase subunit C [Alphaproteobacteria bacterium]